MFGPKLIYQKITQRTARKRVAFFLIGDGLLISLSVWLAFLLRFDGKIPGKYFDTLLGVIVLTLFFSLPIFYLFRLYAFSWAYVSTSELIALVKATTLTFVFLVGSLYLLRTHPRFVIFPRSTLFISYFLILFFAGGFRFAKRLYLQLFPGKSEGQKERTLIVGAGDAGEQILRSIQASSQKNPYLPMGFIDDNPGKQGVMIHGLRVLGRIDDLPQLIKRHQAEGMIVALPTAGAEAIKRAVAKGREGGLEKIKVVPSIAEIIHGQVTLRDLKEVQIEDLLARKVVSWDEGAIRNFLVNKVVLITGAAGSIGSELSRQVAKFKPSALVILDQEETGLFNLIEELRERFPYLSLFSVIGNIRDRQKIKQVFKRFRPRVVFHAAAYKHVPVMEEHPDEAVKNNILGTEIVAKAALQSGAERFVFVSCLDEKTRILTNEGLKRWDEVKSGMRTLSLNRRGEVEENEIEEVISQKYSGPMLQIKTRSIDMLVTANHKMIIQLPNNSANIIEEQARKTVQRAVVYIPKGKWKGIDEERVSLPLPPTDIRHPLRNCPEKVRVDDLLYLLGIFIGDGFLNAGYKRRDGRKTDHYGSISLDIPERDRARKKTLAVLDRMGITYKCYKGKAGEHIYFSSRALAQVFSDCGRGAKNKTIPDWALKYSPRLLQFLLEGLIDSEGYRNVSQRKVTSVSFKLMEKCAELAVKLGLHFTVSVQKNKEAMIDKRKIPPSQSFVGIFSKTNHRAFNKKHCKQINYQGVIWCVRVKNNHNFLAERNGKFYFTGNTDKAINPTSIMGASKRVGEKLCQALNRQGLTKFVSVRFGNVLDSRGNVISLFKEQIKRGGPIKITHPEMKRYFMTTPEACLLVMEAGAMGEGGEVLVLDMGRPLKIVDLAKEMVRLSGFEPDKDIPIVFTRKRPGEKLFEEILASGEGMISTPHQKIFRAKLAEVNEEQLRQGLERLRNVLEQSDKGVIKEILKELVPSYQPAAL